MNAATAAHPDIQTLSAFRLGKLEDPEVERVERHLEHCPECCNTLIDLTDDTFVSLVRSARPSEDDESAAPLDRTRTAADAPAPHGAQAEPSATPPAELVDHPRYEVRSLIGHGGMGSVYLARHKLMNRPVALKLINPSLVRHPLAIERFRREVRAAAQLDHPNIVRAYDAEQAGGVHFLAMEFVDGQDLATVVRQRGPLSIAAACDVARQAALGLQHAHELGMVHRDIKPHNLMISPTGQVRILDFGLADLAAEATLIDAGDPEPVAEPTDAPRSPRLTTAGSVMGTPDFLAPEQAGNARAADIRSDIYSLGCTLYFLLTGRPPFLSESVSELLTAHRDAAPPALAELRPDAPPELSRVVARMMDKDPAQRFQSPREAAAALAPFCSASTAPRPARLRPRRRLALLIAAACGAIFLAGAMYVASNRGIVEIRSEVDDVRVVVKQDGEVVETIDLATGSTVRILPAGQYELQLVGDDNNVTLGPNGFEMTRLGRVVVTASWDQSRMQTLAAIAPTEKPITADRVAPDDGGWKIAVDQPSAVRLFEVPVPKLSPGPFFYRARLKSEALQGRAYLEMWVRIPGRGEFFSRGLDQVVSGTNGWADYEIPFFLQRGQEPDLLKLNLVVEGTGDVWIKDIELRGSPAEKSDGSPPTQR